MKKNIVQIPLNVLNNRIKGYLYTKPEDFEVYEIDNDMFYDTNSCYPLKIKKIRRKMPYYLHFTLVKKNISTFEAVEKLSKELRVRPYQIQHNGLKDTFGVTTQRISIYCNNKLILNKLKKIRFKNFFLKNLKINKKKCKIGSHWGNHFKILVRNPSTSTIKFLKSFPSHIRIPNYYGHQRFGIRQNNHKIGKLILLGKYEQALKRFCTDFNNENQTKKNIRKKLKKYWEDWKECYALIAQERSFTNEKQALAYLLKNNKDYLGALKQTSLCKFFLHSYHSFLFNKALTRLFKSDFGRIRKIPSLGWDTKFNNKLVRTIYKKIMIEEKIRLSHFKIKNDTTLSLKGNKRKIFFKVLNLKHKTGKRNLILEFDIPKGSYASLFLDYIIDNASNNKKLC